MSGIYHEGEAKPPSGQTPDVLAAWIRELLGDVDRAQVRRLAQLRAQFQSDAFEWDSAVLAQGVSTLHSAGRELHFAPLRPGWLDRATGRYRDAYARFIAAHDRMVACAVRLKKELADLAGGLKAHTANARRVLVELEMEWNALQAEVDQGVNWLQDMCMQLGDQRAAGGDDRRLAALAENAQAFTQEFKRMQSVASVAREIGVRGHALLERRAALLEHVKRDADAFEKGWMRALGLLVAELKAGRTSPPSVSQAIEAHDEAMKRLAAASDACSALHHEEHLMAEHLGMLREVLDARRHA